MDFSQVPQGIGQDPGMGLGGMRPGAMPDPGAFSQISQDPRMMKMVQQMAKQKQKKKLEDLLNGGGTHEELAKLFPQLQAWTEQKKIKMAEQKLQDLKEQQLLKRAQQAYEMQQQQLQMQAARNSV